MEATASQIYTYRMRMDLHTNEDGDTIPTYGIEVWVEDALAPTISIGDLFTSLSRAAELVDACNALGLDPIHLMDVIEDSL